MSKIKFIFLTLILLFSLTLVGCKKSTTDQYDIIMERGYVIVGLDDTFAPMGFRDNKNNIVGFDVDLAKLTFNKIGLEVRFQPIDWSMKESELRNLNIDFIWNGYTITEQRKEKVLFSDPYLDNRQVVVTLESKSINNLENLSGKVVGVQSASSSLSAIESRPEIMKSFKDSMPVEYETNDQAFKDLQIGRIDAIVVDEILARYYIALNNLTDVKILEDDFGNELYGVGMRKTDIKLQDAFNEVFTTVKTSDEAKEISIKWFGENIIK